MSSALHRTALLLYIYFVVVVVVVVVIVVAAVLIAAMVIVTVIFVAVVYYIAVFNVVLIAVCKVSVKQHRYRKRKVMMRIRNIRRGGGGGERGFHSKLSNGTILHEKQDYCSVSCTVSFILDVFSSVPRDLDWLRCQGG